MTFTTCTAGWQTLTSQSWEPREATVVENGRAVSTHQMWFWTPAWQAMEAEAQQDIDAGRVDRFDNVEDFIEDLFRA